MIIISTGSEDLIITIEVWPSHLHCPETTDFFIIIHFCLLLRSDQVTSYLTFLKSYRSSTFPSILYTGWWDSDSLWRGWWEGWGWHSCRWCPERSKHPGTVNTRTSQTNHGWSLWRDAWRPQGKLLDHCLQSTEAWIKASLSRELSREQRSRIMRWMVIQCSFVLFLSSLLHLSRGGWQSAVRELVCQLRALHLTVSGGCRLLHIDRCRVV